jgi:DNA-binding MarR family transcriptional regulator
MVKSLDDFSARGGRGAVVSNAKEEKEANFAPALAAAGRALTATMMAKVASCGFKDMTPAFASLMPLLDATGARPSTLAQRAGITKQAISQLVRELEARGYVEQVPDSTDTRAKIVRLTNRGVDIKAACAEVKHELQSIAIAKLGKLRVSRLQRDLIELAAALEETRTR